MVSAAAILVAGVGGKYIYDKIRDAFNKRAMRAEQKKWREKSNPQEHADDNHGSGKVA